MAARKKSVAKTVEVKDKVAAKDEVEVKVVPVAKFEKALKAKRYKAVKIMIYHPFEKVRIPTGSPGVLLERDNWLDCQIERGLIKEV